MKKFCKTHIFLIFVFLLSLFYIVGLCYYVNSAEKKEATYDETNTLHGNDEFIEAMEKAENDYLVENVTISGKPVIDQTGILRGSYLYLYFSCEEYVAEYDSSSKKYVYQWEYQEEKSITLCSEQITVGGQPLMDSIECCFDIDYNLHLDDSTCTDQSLSCISDNYFYPNGIGEEEGILRYSVSGISDGDNASFLARIGNHNYEIFSASGDSPRYIIINGDANDVLYHLSGSSTFLLFVFSAIVFSLIIIFIILEIKKIRKK